MPEVDMLTLIIPGFETALAVGWLACLAAGALTGLLISDALRLLSAD